MSDEAASQADLFPELGELVIATVKHITDYGAYVTLDDYNQTEGLLHISEISSSWVKNIRDYVREKEKVVLKVLRVDTDRRHIDLSLRRVSGKEKQNKLLEWKREKKAESILNMVGEKLGRDPKPFTDEIAMRLEEKYDNAYIGLEELVEKGVELAERLKIPKDWAPTIIEAAQQRIKLPEVNIKGILKLTCTAPSGIDVIKDVLISSKSVKKHRKVKVEIYTVGAPRYMVEVAAKNYKDAEKTMKEIAEYALKAIREAGGEGEFEREE